MKNYDSATVWNELIADMDATNTRGDEDETVAFLAELAGDGPALELAVGTGRIAVPLAATGVRVDAIELSPAMANKLRSRPGGDWQGCFCSLYSGLFKVDWFVFEQSRDERRLIWRGDQPPPYDADGHPWDWIWWLWGKIQTGKRKLASEELAKLWQFLVIRGIPPERFPADVPSPRDDLADLVLRTLDHLPNCRAAAEVRTAIRLDAGSS